MAVARGVPRLAAVSDLAWVLVGVTVLVASEVGGHQNAALAAAGWVAGGLLGLALLRPCLRPPVWARHASMVCRRPATPPPHRGRPHVGGGATRGRVGGRGDRLARRRRFFARCLHLDEPHQRRHRRDQSGRGRRDPASPVGSSPSVHGGPVRGVGRVRGGLGAGRLGHAGIRGPVPPRGTPGRVPGPFSLSPPRSSSRWPSGTVPSPCCERRAERRSVQACASAT